MDNYGVVNERETKGGNKGANSGTLSFELIIFGILERRKSVVKIRREEKQEIERKKKQKKKSHKNHT